MIMVKIRMWVCCVCVHDTRSIIAPPLPHPLGKTDSLLGTIAIFVLQHIRLLRTVANIEYYIMLGPRGLVWTTHGARGRFAFFTITDLIIQFCIIDTIILIKSGKTLLLIMVLSPT